MLKVLFTNEENLSEIIYSSRIFVDPDAPTDILIVSISNPIRLRLRFTDVDEVESFMEILFEGDKINLIEIAKTAPNMEIIVEEDDFMNMLSSMDGEYYENFEDFDDDDDEEDDWGE